MIGTGQHYETGHEFAAAMDAQDPLRAMRDEFVIPPSDGAPTVYLCGNSLGLQPKRAAALVTEELEDWGRLAVNGHFHARRPWLPYHRFATPGLAELTGALAAEVVAMNSLTVNLHLLMAAFYRPDASRYRILIESTAFPSDRYAAASQIRHRGFDPQDGLLEWAPRAGESVLRIEDLESILEHSGKQIALMLLPGVQYYNGQVLDMPALCALARRHGIVLGLDLAHAIGNVPLQLHDWAPDFAAWCSYKYLNSGPGAIAGAFVHASHLRDGGPAQLLGWWGNREQSRFRMQPTFDSADGIEAWQLSNPPVLSLAPVLASLDIFGRAGIPALRKKSIRLTGYLDFLLAAELPEHISTITPRDARGCQLSLVVHSPGLEPLDLFRRLEAQNVVADWREPDVIRVAPVPLYNTFEDVREFVRRLESAIDGDTGSARAPA